MAPLASFCPQGRCWWHDLDLGSCRRWTSRWNHQKWSYMIYIYIYNIIYVKGLGPHTLEVSPTAQNQKAHKGSTLLIWERWCCCRWNPMIPNQRKMNPVQLKIMDPVQDQMNPVQMPQRYFTTQPCTVQRFRFRTLPWTWSGSHGTWTLKLQASHIKDIGMNKCGKITLPKLSIDVSSSSALEAMRQLAFYVHLSVSWIAHQTVENSQPRVPHVESWDP